MNLFNLILKSLSLNETIYFKESPSFIENLTSESNIPSVEFGDAILKCFALGKPAPKVKWYRIMEGNLLEGNLFC